MPESKANFLNLSLWLKITKHILFGFGDVSNVLQSEVIISFHLLADLEYEEESTSNHYSLVIARS